MQYSYSAQYLQIMLQNGNMGAKETIALHRVHRMSLIIEMISEQRLQVGKRGDPMDIWETCIPSRKNSQSKSLFLKAEIKEPKHVDQAQTDHLPKNCEKCEQICNVCDGNKPLEMVRLGTVSLAPNSSSALCVSLYVPLSQ